MDSSHTKGDTVSSGGATQGGATQGEERCSSQEPLPDIQFSTFIISLSTSAMIHLGEIPDPGCDRVNVNLPLARQTIDIIAMLQEKTEGNLDEGEVRLLRDILYDLRIRYVQAAKGEPG